jgi:hypothetical protein
MEVVVRAKKGMMEDYEEFQKLWIANLEEGARMWLGNTLKRWRTTLFPRLPESEEVLFPPVGVNLDTSVEPVVKSKEEEDREVSQLYDKLELLERGISEVAGH